MEGQSLLVVCRTILISDICATKPSAMAVRMGNAIEATDGGASCVWNDIAGADIVGKYGNNMVDVNK